MSVLTSARRLLSCRIQPCLGAGVKLKCSLFSSASGTFQLVPFPKWGGQNYYTYHFRGIHYASGWMGMKSSLQISAPCLPVIHVPTRGVVNYSKRRGKKKSVKAVSKRFHRTGSGKLKYWPAGKVHNMLAKSRNHRRRLRKPKYATKTQLKTLNKMISGW